MLQDDERLPARKRLLLAVTRESDPMDAMKWMVAGFAAAVGGAGFASGCSSSSGAGGPSGDAGKDGTAVMTSTSSGGASSSGSDSGSDASSSGGSSGDSGSGADGSEAGATCGAVGETCCAGSTCASPLACRGGACQNAPANGTGSPCTANSGCPSGICQPESSGGTSAVCSTTCGSASDCVAGWKCAAELGQSSDVCQCAYSTEVCDGKDNDCDGVVDDEPAADQGCSQTAGVGHVCQNGACVCSLTCGGQCVDSKTDWSNCGGCGTTCATGASCMGGSCVCPGGGTACNGACVDEQTDEDNCGGCGKTCAGSTPICLSGACVCSPGSTQCSGAGVQTCGSDSQWGNAVTCPGSSTCKGGLCETTTGTSCATSGAGLTNCGSANESCCTSIEVSGGTYDRTYTNSGGSATGEAAPATVSAFRMDKYPVTVGRFRQFVAAWNNGSGYLPSAGSGKHTHLNGGSGLNATGGGYEAGWDATDWNNTTDVDPTSTNLVNCSGSSATPYATWTSAAGTQENLPINCVNWWEAYAFCIWDGGFLPSEAEWEYVAAGGSQQREYPWGNTAPGAGNQYAIYACVYPNGSTSCSGVTNIAPVGTASSGAGLWGQLDMVGEVWEWNLDWYDPNAPYADPCTDCADLSTTDYRIFRGGAFDTSSSVLPSLPSYRTGIDPKERIYYLGLRCARTP